MSKVQKEISMPVRAGHVLVLGVLMRIGFYVFGRYQDAHMAVKYTDIDYLVFSDAANYVHEGASPYDRETYRYTPLLAWMLLPNAYWVDFGKMVFIVCDLITGVVILKVLGLTNTTELKKSVLSAIWLLNPMVVTISTRGSSESVLTVFVTFFVYFLLKRQALVCGLLCGLSVHFKIYPIIYVPTAVLFLSNYKSLGSLVRNPSQVLNYSTVCFTLASATSFLLLGIIMYSGYGVQFLEQSYFYHLIRTDHRHNFSIYNISLYFSSALPSLSASSSFDLSKWAFFPQMFISTITIPLLFTKKSLTDTLFLQTFAFVTFNKVMTSQYFIWFLIFLPFYLINSSLVSTHKIKGLSCLILWVVSQSSWLFFAYNLEFLGVSTFFPGLLGSSVFFFLSNIYLLGVFMDDIASKEADATSHV